MKRLAAILALGFAACSAPTTPLPGDLQGPQALAVSNSELYVASTNSDELRVLALTADATLRAFEPAPNPIYVLSVPVVTQPIALAADTDGQGHTGPYVFALSAVDRRLGIVEASDKVEHAEVSLPGTPLSMVARSEGDGGARVYVGLTLGNAQGAIATVEVPPPGALDDAGLEAAVAYPLGRAAPAGLDLSPDGSTLAIGDNLPDQGDGGGGLVLLALDGGGLTRLDVGGPVGRVLFSPAASRVGSACPGDAGGDQSFPAGQFLYALVQSTGCALGQHCGGIQVVQLAPSPQVLLNPPLQLPGVATDIAVAPSTATTDSTGDLSLGQTVCESPTLLLAAPSTNGAIYFADGVTGEVYNTATGGAAITSAQFLGPDGGALPDPGGGPDLGDGGAIPDGGLLATGGLPDQTLSVTYEGLLPVLAGRPAMLSDAGALVDPPVDFAALGVQAGDALVLPAECLDGGAASVTSVEPGALGFAPAVDARCIGDGGTYSVRVAGAEPYLVAGSVSGYLGRVAPNATFTSTVPFAYPQPGSSGPALRFQMGSGIPNPVPDEGWSYGITGGVAPLFTYGGADAIQPGPAVWAPAVSRFYVGFPGSSLGGQVSEIDPELVVAGSSNAAVEYQ